jgi:hypothetical protein
MGKGGDGVRSARKGAVGADAERRSSLSHPTSTPTPAPPPLRGRGSQGTR